MNLLNDIRNAFAESKKNTAISIHALAVKYPAWVLRYDDWYGVGIPFSSDIDISERFSNVRLWSNTMTIAGIEQPLLMLTSNIESLRYEFASVCAEFVEPGENGKERISVLKSPLGWWEKWKTLLGNSVQNKQVYSVLGELLVFEKLTATEPEPKWSGPKGASHDIELSDCSYEVKSTIKRYDSTVTINSQFQLQSTGKDISLIFCRFEESNIGQSINDVVERLSLLGVNKEEINSSLLRMGFEIGSSARLKKYKLLEMRRYKVDSNFPSITASSFKEGKIPDSIIQLTYTVDLTGIDYENWVSNNN